MATAQGENVPMTENLLDVEDPYTEDARSPNLLYFATLAREPWRSERHDARLPVLLTETIGLARRAAPVSVLFDLPKDAALASIRVVTPYGEELPSQARTVDGKQNTVEVTFLLDLMALEQVPLFVYYGGQGWAEPEYPVPRAFSLREGRDYYHLENQRLRIELDRETGRVAAVIVAGGSGRNQLGEYFSYVRSNGEIGSLGGTAKVLEDGPVRKTLAYEHRDMKAELSLYPNSSLLHYRLIPGSEQSPRGMLVWTPGGDCRSDYLYYETAKDYYLERRGIKRAKIRYAVSEDLAHYQLPDLKEGWLAFEDQRGEVGGELLSLEDTRKPTLLQHGTGYQIRRSAVGPRRFHGAILAAKGNYETVRKAYIAWMNPPVITLGKPQRRFDGKPKVPVFGETFIRMHYSSYGGPHGFRRANEHTAEELVRYVRRLGANCFGFCAAEPLQDPEIASPDGRATAQLREDLFITQELIPAAHRHGLAVEAGRTETDCPIERRDLFLESAREIAGTGADMISPLAEYCFTPESKEAMERFVEGFGMELPADDYYDDPGRLVQPGYQSLFLFRMNVISDLVRDLSEAVRKERPDVKVCQVTSPAELILRGRSYHDLETQSSWVDLPVVNLYSSSADSVKYHTKYLRGAVGNRRPVMTRFSLFGTGGASRAEATRRQVYLQLLWGTNSLCALSLVARGYRGEEALSEVKKAYDVLDYSGLGDLLVKAQPVKFVGILRDRNTFLDGMRRGKTIADGEYEHRLIGSLVRALGNIPTDIVFSKYLSALGKDGYRVLIIPDAPGLSVANAELIRKYVEGGGSVIVEGEGLKSAVIQSMAKVTPKRGSEATVGQWQVRGTAAPLGGLECQVRARKLAIEDKGAEVLAVCTDGSPAFTSAKCGKGTVIYTPLRISESLDRPGGPAAALKKLIAHLAGPAPVSVVPEDSVAANVLVNREQNVVVLAVYHYTVRPREDAWIDLRPEILGLPEEYEVTELLSGSTVELTGHRLVTELKPYEFRFYALVAPKRFSVPRAESKPAGGIAYSRRPGMKFLKRPVDQIDGTKAGKEGKPKSLKEIIDNLDPEDAMGEDDLDFEE